MMVRKGNSMEILVMGDFHEGTFNMKISERRICEEQFHVMN